MIPKQLLLKQAKQLAIKHNHPIIQRIINYERSNLSGRIPVSFRIDLQRFIEHPCA